MDFFEPIENVDPTTLHPKFRDLNTELGYYGAKNIISEWGRDFHDKDNKAKTEFQTTFHSTFWELYLHAAFKELGFIISTHHNRPDFIIEQPSKLYVEAVVSEISKDGTPEKLRTIEDVERNLHPIDTREEFSEIIDEAITRHSNSFLSKLKKYRGYEKKGKTILGYADCAWVDINKPYVIAIGSYDQIAYGREFVYSMFALLYGKYFDPLTKNYVDKFSIKKTGTNASIKLGLFNDPSNEDVSAVIFSNTLTLGKLSSLHKSKSNSFDTILNIRHFTEEPHFRLHEVGPDNPELLLDGLYVFHNPQARNPLDFKTFSKLAQFSFDSGGLYKIGNNPLIFSRYHTNFIPRELIECLKAETFNRFNPEYCIRELKNLKRGDSKSKKDSIEAKKKRAKKIAQASRKRNR